MKKSVFIFIILCAYHLGAQNNGVYVSDFKLENRAEKWCWAISQDANRNMLIGVTNGIVVFDGINQNFIKLPFTPLQIKFDASNNLAWVSGYERIGILEPTGYANYEYKELALVSNQEFNKIEFIKETVYVVSPTLLTRFNLKDTASQTSVSPGRDLIEEIFELNGEAYFIVDYFLFQIENDAFKEITNVDFPVDEFAYSIPVSATEVILGTTGNDIYMFNGKTFRTRTIGQSAFFDNNLIVTGQPFGDNKILLSSLAGGVALVDLNRLQVTNQISYFNGLPDDEIRAFFVDDEQAVWVSHEFGISRIHFTVGIENYSFYPGLKGSPLAATYFEGELYVATNDGLFTLSEIKNFREFEVSVNVPINVSVDVSTQSQYDTESGANVSAEQKDNSKSLFSFLSKKKKKAEEAKPAGGTEAGSEAVKTESHKREVTQNEVRTIKKRSLKSVSHYFRPLSGVDDKCSQLAAFSGHLLVAGNNGLYAIKNGTAQKVISNVYVYNIYVSTNLTDAYISTNNGLYKVNRSMGKWDLEHFAETTSMRIHAIAQEPNGVWVLGFDNMLIRAKLNGRYIEVINQTDLIEAAGRSFYIKYLDGKTQVFNTNAIYEFLTDGTLKPLSEISAGSLYFGNQADYLWQFANDQWECMLPKDHASLKEQISRLQLFQNLRYIDVTNEGDIWVITENNNFYRIGKDLTIRKASDFKVAVQGVEIENKQQEYDGSINLRAGQNNLTVTLSAPYYLAQKGVKYRFLIDGLDDDWIHWTNDSELQLNYLRPGSYSLKVEAKNASGQLAQLEPVKLKIAKPFFQTFFFYFLLLLVTGGLVYLFFRYRLIKLEKDKEILEQKVKERTHTIEEQKAHIEKQHDEITQSIRYAKRIQTAMLPHDEIIEAMLPNHFILFMPRDIVSGDFYFFKPLGKKMLFIAADCTGHGVPGGFMSMLGISYLSEISSQISNPSASEIIDHLRDKIKLTLGQTSTDSTQKDGMDMAVCIIDVQKQQVEYAGAFNPLYLIRNNELETVKADRQPVAVYFKEAEFTNNVIQVQKGDTFYMFSDGFVDQIGGPSQRKFMSKNFKELLLDVHQLPMNQQKEKLTNTIMDWKGESMQVDDILVIGFQLQ
ncbi:MAG: SpoIIE family protein phosphatase [Salinivirgaceae bacterium]|nr:SpoIIE family protein phosphatase [Salinivirgaceae bacterium]